MDQQIQLGKYRLFHHLATGGMGEVFLAVHEGPAGFAKTVVVKRILASVASDPAFVTMFLNEARLAAMIEHPNVVQIFELGFEENTYFIAMEYVQGRSLRHIRHQLMERKKDFPPELAARICSQALQGLHHAHTLTDAAGHPLNIVHRDVSPDNLLVGFNGVVKVVDFGIAKAEVNVSTTRAGAVKGKYAYMAPEQLTNQQLDRRADIYAMGVLLYELLAGQRPFHATSEAGLIRAILHDEVTPPATSKPDIPEALNRIVMRAMSRDPAARFATAEEMSLALEDYIRSTGKTVTNAHVGALLKELFPEEAATKTPVPPPARTAHPVSYGLTPASGSLPRATPAARTPPLSSPMQAEAGLPEIDIVMDGEEKGSRLGGRKVKWIGAALGGVALLAGAAMLLPRPPKAEASKPVVEVEKPTVVPKPAQNTELPSEPVVAAAPLVPARPIAPQPLPEPEPARRFRAATHHRKPEAREEPAAGATGRVVLRVNPWAEVFWSGRSMGVTPMDPVELPVGPQVLTLRNPNLKLERKVSVNVLADREVVLKADLLE